MWDGRWGSNPASNDKLTGVWQGRYEEGQCAIELAAEGDGIFVVNKMLGSHAERMRL